MGLSKLKLSGRKRASSLLSPRSMRIRKIIVISPGIFGLMAIFFFPRLTRNPVSHLFLLQLEKEDVARFGNVVTSLAIVFVGLSGLYFMIRSGNITWRKPFVEQRERRIYAVFFLCLILTGLGSGWYHYDPVEERLIWDRLPAMTALLSFFAIVVSERISLKAGTHLLWPLLILGAGSAIYWQVGLEQAGRGDIRFYGLIYGYTVLAIPLTLLLFPSRFTQGHYFWRVLFWLALARSCELFEQEIFGLTQYVSGHTLGHCFAAVGVFSIVAMLKRREPLPNT